MSLKDVVVSKVLDLKSARFRHVTRFYCLKHDYRMILVKVKSRAYPLRCEAVLLACRHANFMDACGEDTVVNRDQVSLHMSKVCLMNVPSSRGGIAIIGPTCMHNDFFWDLKRVP